jgi:DNA-binding IclR family transcriptional regulator
MRLAILGQRFYVATGIPDICQPLLDGLASQTREFVRLAVVDRDSLVWVAHSQGATGGLVYQPSLMTSTVPLYATASGKAWLSTLGTEVAVKNVLGNGGFANVDSYGPNAVRSIEGLVREIEVTARRRFGLAVNEAEPGVTALAAAIRSGLGGIALGTLSVAGPSVRMTEGRIQELAPLVMQCASELSKLWPLRPRSARSLSKKHVAEAA